MNRSYIRADELSEDELETLTDRGVVEVAGGDVFVLWNVDAAGDQWLRRIKAGAAVASTPEPVSERQFPEIHGVTDVQTWLRRQWNSFLGRDGEGDDVDA